MGWFGPSGDCGCCDTPECCRLPDWCLCAFPRFYEFVEITLDYDPAGCNFLNFSAVSCDPSGTYVFDAGDCDDADGFERLCVQALGPIVLDLSFDVSSGRVLLQYNAAGFVITLFDFNIDCRNEEVIQEYEVQDSTDGGCTGTRTLTITARLIRI